ncbi:MAG: hypothetical protein M1401_18885 [Chloroflexi bacterium]|nr:hypothetical protein [Chloroflexota bacterium]MCL5110885.1 hypothetical protein [Chloroflexota bacterium]
MRNWVTLATKIEALGESMVDCPRRCEGIAPREGVPPRCLELELEGRTHGPGAVIVGLNPGQAGPVEHSFYRKNGGTYAQVVAFWRKYIGYNHRYYRWLRTLVDQLHLTGPILWTELAKCESARKGQLPPLQTFRTCTKEYLSRELAAVPGSWPLIAVGHEAYVALAYRYPERAVVGVPHPTGSHGHFARLFDGGQLLGEFTNVLDGLWRDDSGLAVWLSRDSAGPPDNEDADAETT